MACWGIRHVGFGRTPVVTLSPAQLQGSSPPRTAKALGSLPTQKSMQGSAVQRPQTLKATPVQACTPLGAVGLTRKPIVIHLHAPTQCPTPGPHLQQPKVFQIGGQQNRTHDQETWGPALRLQVIDPRKPGQAVTLKIQGQGRLPNGANFRMIPRTHIKRQGMIRIQNQTFWKDGQIPPHGPLAFKTLHPFLPDDTPPGIGDGQQKRGGRPTTSQHRFKLPTGGFGMNALRNQAIIQGFCFAQSFLKPPIHRFGSHRCLLLQHDLFRTFLLQNQLHVLRRRVSEFPCLVIGLHSTIHFLATQISLQIGELQGGFFVGQGPVGFAIVIHGMRMPQGTVFAATQREQQG